MSEFTADELRLIAEMALREARMREDYRTSRPETINRYRSLARKARDMIGPKSTDNTPAPAHNDDALNAAARHHIRERYGNVSNYIHGVQLHPATDLAALNYVMGRRNDDPAGISEGLAETQESRDLD